MKKYLIILSGFSCLSLIFFSCTGQIDVNKAFQDSKDAQEACGYECDCNCDSNACTETCISCDENEDIEDEGKRQILWTKTFGGAGNDYLHSLATDSSGNIYMLGNFEEKTKVDFDFTDGTDFYTAKGSFEDTFITKINGDNTYGWTRIFVTEGDNKVEEHAINIDSEDNIYMVGGFHGDVDFNPFDGETETDNKTLTGGYDAFVTKLNADDTYGWTITLGGNVGADKIEAFSVTTDGDGNIFVTGMFEGTVDFDPKADTVNISSNNNSTDVFILKLNSLGDYLWAKTFGGNGADSEKSIITDYDGNVYITGSFKNTVIFDTEEDPKTSKGENDIFVTKINSDGTYGWTVTLGGEGEDVGNAITMDNNEDFYIAATYNRFGAESDILIVKINSEGDIIWETNIGDEQGDVMGLSITALNENLYVTGSFWGSVDFDFTGGVDYHRANGWSDTFLTEIIIGDEDTPRYGWTKTFGGEKIVGGKSIISDSNKNLYIAGEFQGGVNFNPNESFDDFRDSEGKFDIFIRKFPID